MATKTEQEWIEKLKRQHISHEINIGDKFRYNNKDFDICYEYKETRPVYTVTKGRKVLNFNFLIMYPIPSTYTFKGTEYNYNVLQITKEQLWDYLNRQIWLRL